MPVLKRMNRNLIILAAIVADVREENMTSKKMLYSNIKEVLPCLHTLFSACLSNVEILNNLLEVLLSLFQTLHKETILYAENTIAYVTTVVFFHKMRVSMFIYHTVI